MHFKFELTKKGYIRQRESQCLEFKQDFHKGDNIYKYLKTLAGMANNQGGEINIWYSKLPSVTSGVKE